jgi:hypothetical protein
MPFGYFYRMAEHHPGVVHDGPYRQSIQAGRAGQLIDGLLEKVSRILIANEQPPVLDPDIIVENAFRSGVCVDDKSVTVDGGRRQAHRIERGDWGSGRSACSRDRRDIDQAPGEGGKNALFVGTQICWDIRPKKFPPVFVTTHCSPLR